MARRDEYRDLVMRIDINKAAFVVSFHYHIYGPSEALIEFLRKQRAKKLLVIRHPLFVNENATSIIEEYRWGFLTKRYKFKLVSHRLIASLPGFIITILTTILLAKSWRKNVIFIGFNPANAIAGVILRAIKAVDYVIVHSHMYHFKYDGYCSNTLYQLLHRISLHEADKIWCVSRMLKQVYEKKFMVNSDKVLIVPNGVKSTSTCKLIDETTARTRIVFVGHLSERSGVKLLMSAISLLPPDILSKLEITIIGDGPLSPTLRNFVKKNKLNEFINVVGLVKHDEVMRLLPSYDVGLALYPPYLFPEEWAADPIKPKEYLASGLALILTHVLWTSELATEVDLFHAGIVINYNIESLVNALETVSLDRNILESFKKGARELAQKHNYWSWTTIFKKAFEDTFKQVAF